MITSNTIEDAIRLALDKDRSNAPAVMRCSNDHMPEIIITPSRPLSKLLTKLLEEDPDASDLIFKLGDLGVSEWSF
jgi:hypothetical protein